MGYPGFQDGINGTFKYPTSLALYENNIYVADRGNKAIRIIQSSNFMVSTFLGADLVLKQGKNPLQSPSKISIVSNGVMFILDASSNSLVQFNLKAYYYDTSKGNETGNQTNLYATIALVITSVSLILAAIVYTIYRKKHLKQTKSTAQKLLPTAWLTNLSLNSSIFSEASQTVSISKSGKFKSPNFNNLISFY